MKTILRSLKYLYYLLCGIFILYLLIPAPEFPAPPLQSVQSKEIADTADPASRRAYFTDLTREQVRLHYQQAFTHANLLKFIPSINLQNYPREEAAWHVYDPVKSSYLEELIYPFRESLFINFYEPSPDEDKIAFEGQEYKIKITLRYYQSSLISRIALALLTFVTIPLLSSLYWQELRPLLLIPISWRKKGSRGVTATK